MSSPIIQSVIKNVYIIDNFDDKNPSASPKFDVVIEGGKISSILPSNGKTYDMQEIDGSGKVLIPGIIDMQVHFRDPGQTFKEDIITGSTAAAAGGVTSVVCQPNTKPCLDSEVSLDYLHYKALDKGLCNVYVYAAVTNDLKGESLTDMISLYEKDYIVGFTDDGLPVKNAFLMQKALEISRVTGCVIAQHAEDLSLTNKGCMNEGEASVKLGVPGINNLSESVCVARDIELLRTTGGHYHVLHVSTRQSVELIRNAKAEGLNITCEAAPHHFLLTDEAVLEKGVNAKMNPPLRSEADRQALIEGLMDGTIDAIATDHAPHDFDSKGNILETAAFGIIGVQHILPLSLELYQQGYLSLKEVIAKLTSIPAKILKLHSKGQIKEGLDADLALVDFNLEHEISEHENKSRSSNSPFWGRKVKGKAVMTILGGKVVFEG